MTKPADIRQRMAAAIMDAIIETNRMPGQEESLVNPAEAIESLIVTIGMLVEANADMSTNKAITEFSGGVAKDLAKQIKVLRAHYERTGAARLEGLHGEFAMTPEQELWACAMHVEKLFGEDGPRHVAERIGL